MPRFRFFIGRWPVLALAGLAVAATAQTVSPPPGSPPGPAAQPSAWRSAFEGYRPYADAPVAPWRESNDTVGRIGGWRAYAREAAQPATAPGSAGAPTGQAPSPAAAPAPAHQH